MMAEDKWEWLERTLQVLPDTGIDGEIMAVIRAADSIAHAKGMTQNGLLKCVNMLRSSVIRAEESE